MIDWIGMIFINGHINRQDEQSPWRARHIQVKEIDHALGEKEFHSSKIRRKNKRKGTNGNKRLDRRGSET
jgi:hypothetical protein